MKKMIILSLAVFWIIVFSLLGSSPALTKGNGFLGAFLPANNFSAGNQTPVVDDGGGQVLPIGEIAAANQAGLLTNKQANQSSILNAQAVAAHNSANSCWMIISGKVYDLTSYLSKHPAGASSMLSYCGQDGTAAFSTKDANPAKPHSNYANSLLAPYLVGSLGQVLSAAAPTVQAVSGNAAAAVAVKTPIPVPTSLRAPSAPAVPSINLGSSTPTPTPGSPVAALTGSVVSTHSSAASCWMIIGNNVYDVTSYLPRHPGGVNAILPYCGQDGAAAFTGLPHSQSATNLLASYYIGALNNSPTVDSVPAASQPPASTLAPTVTLTPTSTPAPTATTRPGRNDDDDDDD